MSIESQSVIDGWISTYGATYPIARDNGGATFTAYNIYYIPHSFLIDKNGDIAWDHIGSAEFSSYKAQIDVLLGP